MTAEKKSRAGLAAPLPSCTYSWPRAAVSLPAGTQVQFASEQTRMRRLQIPHF
jgi:hypothetical protein